MDKRFKLADDILENVAGGVEIKKNTQAGKSGITGNIGKQEVRRTTLICERCGKDVNQIEYSDGSVKYATCPHFGCGNPLGVG